MKNLTKSEKWEFLIEKSICTEGELQLLTDITGYSDTTLDNALYAREGYNDFESYIEDEGR